MNLKIESVYKKEKVKLNFVDFDSTCAEKCTIKNVEKFKMIIPKYIAVIGLLIRSLKKRTNIKFGMDKPD